MRARWIGVLAGLAVAGCTPDPAVVPDSGSGAQAVPAEVSRRIAEDGAARVILTLDDAELGPLPDTRATEAERAEVFRQRAARWTELLADTIEVLPARVGVVRSYDNLPLLVVDVDDPGSATALMAMPGVLAMEAERTFTTELTQSLPLIGQPTAASQGFVGANTSVAVLDTGADWTQADLGSCTAVNTPASCRVAYAADFAPNDGQRDANGHGTNVSAIVGAVAPGTDILALDVFNGSGASSVDIVSAIDWVITNQATYHIAAINLSLGGGLYTSPCVDAFGTAIDNARAAGVAVAVASGNDARSNAMASPACNAGAFSVGAVYDSNMGGISWSNCSDAATAADRVTCFSNSTSFLDVLAPGALIVAGGHTMGGTSQATPHVAGALAVLRAKDPTATVAELEDLLKTTGTTVVDHRNGLSFPRIDLADAAADCVTGVSPTADTATGGVDGGTVSVSGPAGCAWTATSDVAWLTVGASAGTGSGSVAWTTAANTGGARVGHVLISGRPVTITQDPAIGPDGTVVIDGGADATNTTAVTLSLAAAGASQVCLSNTASCTSWRAMASSVGWTLAGGEGQKQVYATFKDAWGNAGDAAADTIVLDQTAPTGGSLAITGQDAAAELSWEGTFADETALDHYLVMQAAGAVAPTSCNGAPVYEGPLETIVRTGLTNGSTYAWRVCAVDTAGNVSRGVVGTLRIAPEYDGPVGTITLDSGAAWTRSASVTVAFAATDASTITHTCLSNTTSCTSWTAYAPTASWTLGNGEGSHEVHALFKDQWGNVGDLVSDTISVDTTVPTDGTLTATGADARVVFGWSGFADAASGVASYGIVQATGATAPGSCSGTPVWSGTGTSATVSGLANGTTYSFRLCAWDAAGNRSAGATATARVAPEFAGPVGTVSVNAGAAWTKTASVTVSLSATDASGVTQACLSNTSTCNTWFTMVPSKRWSLPSGNGTKTVYARFKDAWGNLGSVVSDSIGLDTVVPTNGTVTATGGISGGATLSWTGFTDDRSGIASYVVVQASSATPPSSCSGTAVWTGSASPAHLTGLVDGNTYAWRVCAFDAAGNRSTGAGTSLRVAPEYVAPVGQITLEAGADWTNASSVLVDLSATDATGVAEACLSNGPTCTAWFAMVAQKRWTMPAGTGAKRVYGQFRDPYKNVSAVVSDTINVDNVPPVDGSITATSGDGQAVLTWTGFTDAASGVASYVVVQADGSTAPANCGGTAVWSGTRTTATVTGLDNASTYAWRVCALDAAGNRSTGATTNVRVASEFDPPVGSVVIDGGAGWTRVSSVSLALAATDANDVTDVCVSNTTTCSAWVAMAASMSWSLPAGTGTKTVYVWYRDSLNNVSDPVSDSIGVDTAVPTNGTLSAQGGDARATLTFSGFADALSGVASYVAVQAAGTSAPSNCGGTAVWSGSSSPAVVTGLTNGSTYAWRVCALDEAGNRSTGATASARAAPEYVAPTGTVVLNGGDAWTRTASVTAALAASDASTVTRACLSNTATCTTWFDMADTKAWTLAAGAGEKTVRAWYQDPWGNVSSEAVDTIGLDTAVPTNGTVTATPGPGGATLAWSGFADAHSGIESYVVVQATGAPAPASCSGVPVYSGADLGVALTGLTPGQKYAWRVCAVDLATNRSSGSVASTTVQ